MNSTFPEVRYIDSIINLENSLWKGWDDISIISEYVPGGKKYNQLYYKQNTSESEYYKIFQKYLNANRLEAAILHIFQNFSWLDNTHDTFHTGVGSKYADFKILNQDVSVDAKLYKDYDSFKKYLLDLCANDTISIEQWTKNMNSVFHTAQMILAFCNDTKELYVVIRPKDALDFKLRESELVQLRDDFIPNTLVTMTEDGLKYTFDETTNFKMIIFTDDPKNCSINKKCFKYI